MLVVDDHPLLTDGLVGTQVLVNTPVAAPSAQNATTARHAARQLLDGRAVVEGEIPGCDGDVAKPERQGDCDEVLSRRDHGDSAGVRRMAGDSRFRDNGRTVAVLEEAGVGLVFLQHWKSRDCQSHRPALVPADVGGVEVLDGQTLLLHVEAPQPLTRLLPTGTLRLQRTPSLQDTPATVGVVGQQAGVAVLVLLAFSHRPLLQHGMSHDEEMLLSLVQDEVRADGCVPLNGDDRVLLHFTVWPQEHLVQVPLGVSQEGDGMSRPHADGHSSETGGRAVQYGLCLDGHLAGHRAGGVV